MDVGGGEEEQGDQEGSVLEQLSRRDLLFCVYRENSDKNPVPLTTAEFERLKRVLRIKKISILRVGNEGLLDEGNSDAPTTNAAMEEEDHDAATLPEVLLAATSSLEDLISLLVKTLLLQVTYFPRPKRTLQHKPWIRWGMPFVRGVGLSVGL